MPSTDYRNVAAYVLLGLIALKWTRLAMRSWWSDRTRFRLALASFAVALTVFAADRALIWLAMLTETGWLSARSWLTEASLWALVLAAIWMVTEQEWELGWRPPWVRP